MMNQYPGKVASLNQTLICHVSEPLPSSLVPLYGITPSPGLISEREPHLTVPRCPDGGWLKGNCLEHGTQRWVRIACKKRTCEVCGQVRKERIAWRITRGIEMLAGEDGAGWHVLTFPRNITKKESVDMAEQYMQWLARYFKRVFDIKFEFAKVWERHKSGRIHLNIIIAPWRFIKQAVLDRKWHDFGGGILYIKRVGSGIGVEAAKSRYRMGLYLAKFDQMIYQGRGVSYSKGFPKLPELPQIPRRGVVGWVFVGGMSQEAIEHWYDTEMGNWVEVAGGEYKSVDGEPCDCFDFKVSPVRKARGIMKALEKLKKKGGKYAEGGDGHSKGQRNSVASCFRPTRF